MGKPNVFKIELDEQTLDTGIRIFVKRLKMKKSLVALLLVLTVSPVFSQKVKMSDKAKDKYMKEAEAEAAEEAGNTVEVFQILSAEVSDRGEGLLLTLKEPTSEIPTRVATLQFPELKMLTANKLARSETITSRRI